MMAEVTAEVMVEGEVVQEEVGMGEGRGEQERREKERERDQ